MYEHELDSIRSKAGALKAEITSIAMHDELKAACELVDQGVGKVEAFLATREQELGQEKKGGPKIDGTVGLVGDEDEEEVEEEEADGTKKTVKRKKARKS